MPCSDMEDHAASIISQKLEAARSSEILVLYHVTMWCHNPEDHNVNVIGLLESLLVFLQGQNGFWKTQST